MSPRAVSTPVRAIRTIASVGASGRAALNAGSLTALTRGASCAPATGTARVVAPPATSGHASPRFQRGVASTRASRLCGTGPSVTNSVSVLTCLTAMVR